MNKLVEIVNIIFSFFRQLWKYKFRDPGMAFATYVLGSGVTILVSGGMWKLLFATEILNLPFEISFDANDFSSLGVVLIIVSLGIGIFRLHQLGKQISGILIIHRGMEGMDTNSIKKALPRSFLFGKFEIIDLNEGHQLHNGKIISPERALEVVNGLDQQIKTRLHGNNLSDIKLAFGGLAPIPLLVAAGYKITSRQECLLLDYSRSHSWHGLDDVDDNEAIQIEPPHADISTIAAVVLPLSVEISKSQIPKALQNYTYIVRLENGARPDSLNSNEKQIRVAREFYKICANMKAKHSNLEVIHIFIASQASFAFRLGTMITPSVLPKISVYQFDTSTNKYDWGVNFAPGSQPTITNINNT